MKLEANDKVKYLVDDTIYEVYEHIKDIVYIIYKSNNCAMVRPVNISEVEYIKETK